MTESKDFNPEDHLLFEQEKTAPKEASVQESSGPDAGIRGAPSDKQSSPNYEEEISPEKVGRIIADRMEEHGFHPVVIFGSSNSGKSTMIQSLFSYLMTEVDKGVGIYLDESMIPVGTAYGRFALERAQAFFYKGMQEFIDGKGPQATRVVAPFFIPVRIVPPNKPEIRLAFMESAGEWYKPQRDTARFYQELREEVNGLLLNYQRGITFLHIVPFTQQETWTSERANEERNKEEIRDADSAIVGALTSYESIRPFKTDDSHMMIMTKWDARKPDEGHESLEDALLNVSDTALVSALINQYQQGYSAFNSLMIPNDRKRLMRYCAGIMRGMEVVPPKTEELQNALNMYRQNLWNWLYSNAVRTNPDISAELLLFDPPPKKPISIFDKITLTLGKLLAGE